MALVVEDGAGKPDADSYISLIAARDYAAKFGYALPVDDTEAEVALRQGAQYVDLQEQSFCGQRTNPEQGLAWPRTGAKNIYGFHYASDYMPPQLGYAQVAAAAEYGAGTDVRATDDGKSIASEEVTGAVAVSYFNNGKTGGSVVITRSMDTLKPLMACQSNSGSEFRVTRA